MLFHFSIGPKTGTSVGTPSYKSTDHGLTFENFEKHLFDIIKSTFLTWYGVQRLKNFKTSPHEIVKVASLAVVGGII